MVLTALASLRLTVVGLCALAVSVGATYLTDMPYTWSVALPLLLLAVNLLAAVLTHPLFRVRMPLLLFHLALLLMIVLAAAGRLTYLKGGFELAERQTFDGALQYAEQGPLHRFRLAAFELHNEGFQANYLNGLAGPTSSRMSWLGADGQRRRAAIGTQRPLVIGSYRIYPAFDQGLAPVFAWTPQGGRTEVGSVHLPSYPASPLKQAITWTPPGGEQELWFSLEFEGRLIGSEGPSRFEPPKAHRLVVRYGDRRHVLEPGDRLPLAGGELQYLELRSWLGYVVHYDWTRLWLLAAALVATLSLGWHYWRHHFSRPWPAGGAPEPAGDERL